MAWGIFRDCLRNVRNFAVRVNAVPAKYTEFIKRIDTPQSFSRWKRRETEFKVATPALDMIEIGIVLLLVESYEELALEEETAAG